MPTAPRPTLLTPAGRYDASAILTLAHAEARANVARAAARGVIRRYATALKLALADVWSTARTQRECALRDAALATVPAAHAALLAERTAALMIDSTVRMSAELAAIDARAKALGLAL